ncbi:MAG: D-2-hydroxyacid dehydrogenase family protein [Chloroflexi bacterium]|nr:D-2-hydroxyacid dehydrogenase family protein [Chloroflexota bacterium]
MADWSVLPGDINVETFRDHLSDESAMAQRLRDYDIVIGMRERTPMSRSLLQQLPNLKLLITTGMANASFDVEAATEMGIVVAGTYSSSVGTVELTWGLILALARSIALEDRAIREGAWQHTVGQDLAHKTLGVIGLGNIGSQVAKIGLAFQMQVLAWSQNLTRERAQSVGATYAAEDELLSRSDLVTIHLKLSNRTKGLIGARELGLMKPTAYLINTSRGPIVDEQALIQALRSKTIQGAGLDVYDVEPLPPDHPLRHLENTVVTPHLGYVTDDVYKRMFADAIENIQTFLKGRPVRVLNSPVLEYPKLRGMR